MSKKKSQRLAALVDFHVLPESESVCTNSNLMLFNSLGLDLNDLEKMADVVGLKAKDLLSLGYENPRKDKSEDVSLAVASSHGTASGEAESLRSLATRLRLKAEGCGWAAERLRLKQNGADHQADISPTDRDLIARGKATNCYLWMNTPTAFVPADLAIYETVAGCFLAVALLVEVVSDIELELPDHKRLIEEYLPKMAEAQSALKSGIADLGSANDVDQEMVFDWLKKKCNSTGVFVERHMRLDDPADPAKWPERLDQVALLDNEVRNSIRIQKQQRKLINKLRYQVSRIEDGSSASESQWWRVAETLEKMKSAGIHPSDIRLREILLPHIERIPAFKEAPRGFELVVRELKRYSKSTETERLFTVRKVAPEIAKVASLLEGKSMVLICGECRRPQKTALEAAFRLSELIWIEPTHGTSVSTLEPFVARSDVAVILLAIRWASHAHGDVIHMCNKYEKPMVRLPAGYSPTQVATQISNQCSERLKSAFSVMK